MNYQSCTIEELISFSNFGDIKASVEIARRVSEGLLDQYEDNLSTLERELETLGGDYEDLLEEESRLNQTIGELNDSLSDLEFEKDWEISNLEGEVFDSQQRVDGLESELEELRGEA